MTVSDLEGNFICFKSFYFLHQVKYGTVYMWYVYTHTHTHTAETNPKVYNVMVCNLKCSIETCGLFKITSSHVQCRPKW